MASLYELSGQYVAVLTALDLCEDDTEEQQLLSQLDELSGDIADKGEAYARILRNEQAEADAFAAEIKRLTARKAAKERTIAHLKENLLGAMRLTGTTQLATGIGKWRIQKNPASVAVLDEAAIPTEYLIPQPAKVDKRAILAAYKETGEIPEGTDIVQTDGLRFR